MFLDTEDYTNLIYINKNNINKNFEYLVKPIILLKYY
jgi:hypothetical protein